MRLFKDRERAEESYDRKQSLWMNSVCPFNDEKLCGSWCALFYYEKRESNEIGVSYIMLGCKSTDKQLFIDGIVE
jgi:hypothetical protein